LSSPVTPPNAPSGERRHVTALFADMVGFTAISERLGEEGTFALIQPIYELMARAVREQGGSVKDFTGDGIMALFGAPDALEDAPLRGCRAGLAIHERLAAAASAIEAKHGVRPQMRIGVNSGLAVVTQIRGENGPMTALGDTVNLASRLQTLAEPGTVFLSETTQRLVQGPVETTFAGDHAIKGKAEPQKVYRLDAIRHGATRFEAAVGRGLSVYVGRERELDILERALAEARGELRVIDIVAEPGMGKSRLLYEFRQRIGKEQAVILTGNCSPDGQQTPFLPFIEVVRGSFQVRSGEAENEVARKLEMGLTLLGLHSQENLGLLLNLLGLKPPEGSLSGLDGVLIGLRTRDLLQNMLEARRSLSPVVLVIEDLHWIDSVSREVLGKIVDGEAKLELLILHTRRPEYEPAWGDRPAVTALQLEPLPAGDIRRLVETRLGVDALPETLARQVAEKAEGNALFAEEILSFLTERGVLRVAGGKVEFDANATAALPASVRSLLTARVDRLAPEDRALLQAAAVIGRRFDPQLLAAVAEDAGDIVDLDPEIPDGALDLRVSEKQLDRSQIAGLAVDLRCLRAAHRMRAVG
jgi:class 3 adenylate cyclase